MLKHWVNDGEFAGAVRLNPKSMDPKVGKQDPATVWATGKDEYSFKFGIR